MKPYWGFISYYATGEGTTSWGYIGAAESPDEFKTKMQTELDIPDYYMIDVEISDTITADTPVVIFQHWKSLVGVHEGTSSIYGEFKYNFHVNYS